MLYLSQLLGATVTDRTNERLGKIVDVLAQATGVGQDELAYPLAIVVSVDDNDERRIPYKDLSHTEDGWSLHTLSAVLPAPTQTLTGDEIYLARDVMDKQVIDLEHKKAVRVNDICFGDDWRILGVDRSPLGLARRLAPAWLLNALNQRSGSAIVPWSSIELINTEQTLPPRPSQGHLGDMHPADIATILHQLSAEQGARVLERLDTETAAHTMEEIETEHQAHIVGNLAQDKAVAILHEMGPDEIADLLAQLPEDQARQLLSSLEPEELEEVQDLLAYESDTAGGLMTTDYIALNSERTVEEAFAAIRANIREYDIRNAYIYCVEDENQDETRLTGVVSIWDMLIADSKQQLHEFMETDVIKVEPDTDPETVAETLAKYNLLGIPVVNSAGILEGVITVDDALDIILPPERRSRPHRKY